MTGDQRVFLGWAQVWRGKYRDDAMKQQVVSDPHSPPEFRVVGPMRNIDAWYDAFGVQEGEKYYVKPEEHAFEVGDGRSYGDRVFGGLTDDQMRARPGRSLNPLVWLLWHMARTEDAAPHSHARPRTIRPPRRRATAIVSTIDTAIVTKRRALAEWDPKAVSDTANTVQYAFISTWKAAGTQMLYPHST